MAEYCFGILAESPEKEGTKNLFYSWAGRCSSCQTHCAKKRYLIDVRHEQAAALSAQAYSGCCRNPACAWRRAALRDQSDPPASPTR